MKISEYHASHIYSRIYHCDWFVWQSQPERALPKEFVQPKALLGTALHKAIYKIDNLHHQPSDTFTKSLWGIGWEEALREAEAPVNWFPDEATERPQIYELGTTLFNGYCENVPDFKILYSEEEMKFKIGKYDWVGTLDQLVEMPDGRVVLVDIKTGENLPTDDLILHSYQLAAYCLGAKNCLGIMPDAVAIHHLRDYNPYAYTKEGKKTYTYLDVGKQKNEAKRRWVHDNGRLTDNGKYRFESGQLRGPGWYEFPINLELLEKMERLLIAEAGSLALANPTPRYSDNCNRCSLFAACRANADMNFNETEKRQLKKLTKIAEGV